MEGFATMYMRMPMSSSNLPIQGACVVDGKKVTLKFPFTGIEFELPKVPSKDQNDFDFKIRGARGDMTITISYIKDLQSFHGVGRQEEDDGPVVNFTFYDKDSPMAGLPIF